jgi:hypothetical protein
VKALQVGTESAGKVLLPGPIPTFEDERERPEATVLQPVVHLCRLLPPGWSAEVGPESIVLSWGTG